MIETADCYTCAMRDQADAPPRESIATDAHWRVAHSFNTALPGWLVLVPQRHVTAIADLTDEEAAGLGVWQVRLSRALAKVTGCEKTYVVQFAEADQHQHVHFHVVPRAADMPPEFRGRHVFDLLMRPEHERLTEGQRDKIALALRAALEA
jgi:diadenosine tetraphosphate (Ap4A) HIT family hydrolase